ncbi:MAG: nucleoside-triphosphatase [Bacteroidales bacterium]|nr:nucleoside-triphosphatase [Bacteroidales bacterium]MDT8431694.1 nucleoside-triphosphatase [Bacteroidales bacterium]
MMNNHAAQLKLSLSPKWIMAAAIGSIWAAIEIVAGSFLHNLRIPFSGTMLAMAAVYLLVAFAMQWKEPGIIIRAGLIAALMKSISPSAVILGPMVGIFMEAVILEVTWLLLGRNLTGFIIGGMLAVTWSLLQKVFSLLILYGFDLLRIAEAFYLFLVKSTGLESLDPLYLLLLVTAIYLVAGTIAALAGYVSFRQLQNKPPDPGNTTHIDASQGLPFGAQPEKQRYASLNLLLILFLLAATLYFLNSKSYIPALLSGGAIITGALIRYKRAVRYLKKPSLWIQLLIITLLAALLWEWISTGRFLSVNGLIVGLEINFRALVIIFSFAAISVELRNPLVRSLLYRNGFSNLYKSVSLAFSVLPSIIEQIPTKNNLFRQRKNVLHTILHIAESLISVMEKASPPHYNIFLVTGNVQGGKSGFVSRLIELCRHKQCNMAGFVAEGTFKDGRRDSFFLTDIRTGKKLQLGGRIKENGWTRYRDFYFNPEAFTLGEKMLGAGLENGAELLVLDELGPMELAGEGWSGIIGKLEKNYDIPQVWVVRDRILCEVRERWNVPAQNVVNAAGADPLELLNRINEWNKQRK